MDGEDIHYIFWCTLPYWSDLGRCIMVLYGWTVRPLRKKKKSILIVEEIQLWLAASWCISCARPRTVTKQPDHCCRHTRRDPWALSFSFPFLSFSLSLSLSHTHTHTHVRTAEEAPVWIISKCMLESLTCVWSAVSRVCMSNWVYFYCTCATVSADKITCKLDLS